MALTTEEAAVNTALTAYFTAIEALIAAKSAGDVIHFVPSDLGDSALYDHSRSNNDTAVTTSFSQRVAHEVVADGEFPIQIAGGVNGSLVPLGWFVTNAANDLS